MFHKALDVALPGDVIVVDGGGGLTNALCGELMVAYAVRRQIAGFVVNGAIRDSSAIARGDFPVFAAGVTHRGPYKDGPGEINSAIAIDGMVIEPGDLILGDEDGFVCVPYGDLDSVFKVAQSKHAEEAAQMLEIAAGKSSRTWIDAKLTNLGCEF
jgi:regulator of RNase E activity RraA